MLRSFLLFLAVLCLQSLSLPVLASPRHSHERLRGEVVDEAAAGSISAPDGRYKDYVADGWITRGAVVAFNESVSAQHKEDWLNTLLYAQLVCRSHSGFDKPAQWMDCVIRALLVDLNWSWHSWENLKPLARADVALPLAETVLSKADGKQGPGLPASCQRLARAAVEALKDEDAAFTAFHNYSTNATRNFFLVSVVSETAKGDAVAWTVFYHITTTAQPYQLLWSTYPDKAVAMQGAVFDSTQSAWNDDYRQAVKNALVKFLPQAIYSKPIKL